MMPARGSARATKRPKTMAKQNFQFSVTMDCQSVTTASRNASGFSKLKWCLWIVYIGERYAIILATVTLIVLALATFGDVTQIGLFLLAKVSK
jgi:hypothetical protein